MHTYILQLGPQNKFELLRILNYWSLNYRGSTLYSVSSYRIYANIRNTLTLFLLNPDMPCLSENKIGSNRAEFEPTISRLKVECTNH